MRRATGRAPAPRVGIVILTWNNWDATRACLRSVEALDHPNRVVVVVDNGSTDGTVAQLRRSFPAIEVISNRRNLGFAAGANQGAWRALDSGADHLLFLNNDTLVPADLLARCLEAFDRLPRAGALSPAVRGSGAGANGVAAGGRCNRLTLECERVAAESLARITEVDYLFGTALFVSARAFRAVGGFDEAFFFYYEDMDLSLRLARAGYRLYLIPTVVRHDEASSTASHLPFRYYLKARGSALFFRKHAGRRWPVILLSRSISALLTSIRILWRGPHRALFAYWRGLLDGLRQPSDTQADQVMHYSP